MQRETISVIGLGKLGLCMAACLADRGYQVIGIDIDRSIIKAVNSGRSPHYEPGMPELMERVKGNFMATDDYKYAIENSSIIFIFVATPSETDGSFSTRYVEQASKEIATHLKDVNDFRLIVLRSTVLPGVSETVVKPLLEEVSGKKCGIGFGLCYNPETLALGSIIRDFLNPDIIIIGESDNGAGELLATLYQRVCQNNPVIERTTLNNSEMAKISFNVFLAMKISFANTLAELSEQIPSGDVDVISRILGYDTRIGRKFLTGALGYGGPCFPRDTRAFSALALQYNGQAKIIQAAEEVNNLQHGRIVETIEQRIGSVKGKAIAILGLTYKPDTDIVEESDAIRIAASLLKEGAFLRVYDPAGMENARPILGQVKIDYAESAIDCLHGAELCILTTPWDEFKALNPEDFIVHMKKPVVQDCWRILMRSEFIDKLDYSAVGLNIMQ